jgi:hypothetical protein|tara:strand:- start:1656 stop:1877 length:222 start_codon:yes stop_codon:yes gene_type:complete
MTKFKIEIVAKDYYIVEVEADDEFKAKERVVTEICQEGWLEIKHHGTQFVNGKETLPTLQYLDSVWDFQVIDK